MHNIPEVFIFNKSFLKLNRFIYNGKFLGTLNINWLTLKLNYLVAM